MVTATTSPRPAARAPKSGEPTSCDPDPPPPAGNTHLPRTAVSRAHWGEGRCGFAAWQDHAMPAGTNDPMRWQHLGAEPGYRGFLALDRRTYRLPDGRRTVWDVLTQGPAVRLVALTPDGRVVCVRQFRPGPDAVLIEIPGGMVDAGEDLLSCAARELLEETGYRSNELALVGRTWLAGFSTQQRFAVIARDCVRVADPVRGEDEFCEPVELTMTQFVAHVRAGDLTDMDLAYQCLDHLGVLVG